MRDLIQNVERNLRRENHIMGIFSFGSVIAANIDVYSDLDIAMVYDAPAGRYPLVEEEVIDNITIEICRYPMSIFQHVFDDAEWRGREDSWINLSTWIDLMKKCEIIFDPVQKLSLWKEKALNWRWREDEIQPVKERLMQNITMCDKSLEKHKKLNALISLREATSSFIYLQLMKQDMVPYWKPKHLISLLQSRKNDFGNLLNLYSNINDFNIVKKPLLRSLIQDLQEHIDREATELDRGLAVAQFRDAISSFYRGDLGIALIYARLSAFHLAFRMLKTRQIIDSITWTSLLINAKRHVEMLSNILTTSPTFFQFYRKLHCLDMWSMAKIKNNLGQIK